MGSVSAAGETIQLPRRWHVSRVREVIIGGDGASRTWAGVEDFPGAIWQLDSFHLARACGGAYDAQVGRELYQALRAGQAAEAEEWLQHAPLLDDRQAQRDSRWVKRVAREGWGLDWRVRRGANGEEERGMGGMEGNKAHK